MEIIDETIDVKPWLFPRVSKNPNLTVDMLLKHPDRGWDWMAMSENDSLSMVMVRAFPHKPWNRNCIARVHSFPAEREAYVFRKLRQLSLLSVLDGHHNLSLCQEEATATATAIPEPCTVYDLVFLNEYIVSSIYVFI